MTLRSKVMTATLFAAAALLAVSGAAFFRTRVAGDLVERFAGEQYAQTLLLSQIQRSHEEADAAANAVLALVKAPAASRAEASENLDLGLTVLDEGMTSYGARPLPAGVRRDWERVKASLCAWTEELRHLGALAGQEPPGADGPRLQAAWRSAHLAGKRAESVLLAHLTLVANDVQRTREASRSSTRRTLWFIALSTLAGLACMAAGGTVLRRSIERTVAALVAQAQLLQRAVAAGELDVRANPAAAGEDFRPVLDGVNEVLDTLVRPLRQIALRLDGIARGSLPEIVADEYRGEFATERDNLNRCVTAIDALLGEVRTLAQAAVEGRLKVRADPSRHQGEFRRIIELVNATLSTLVGHLDVMPAAAMILDPALVITYVNEAGARLLSREASEIVGTRCRDQLPGHDGATCVCARALREARAETGSAEGTLRGRAVALDFSSAPILDADGRGLAAFTIITDETETRRAVRVAEKITDYQSRQTDRVTAALEQLAHGHFALDLGVEPGDDDTAGPREVFELIAAAVLRCAETSRRSKQMELELQQAQKLESVGRLAAGIAHEINTPIQFIGDGTTFVGEALAAFNRALDRYGAAARPEVTAELARLAEDDDLDYFRAQAPKTVERTLQGIQRVASIVRAMREFAHPDGSEMVETDLNRAVEATLEVARNEYKYVADVERDLGSIPGVTCHAGEINQVLLNLLVNAAHAIADSVHAKDERGKIRVATRCEHADVLIAISDTGTGIPENVRSRIFDPFFTTKEVGRGTGQGLALARAVVLKHRGTITFETEVGKGTTFLVRLPIHGATAARTSP